MQLVSMFRDLQHCFCVQGVRGLSLFTGMSDRSKNLSDSAALWCHVCACMSCRMDAGSDALSETNTSTICGLTAICCFAEMQL